MADVMQSEEACESQALPGEVEAKSDYSDVGRNK